jgi:hypothetical protein
LSRTALLFCGHKSGKRERGRRISTGGAREGGGERKRSKGQRGKSRQQRRRIDSSLAPSLAKLTPLLFPQIAVSFTFRPRTWPTYCELSTE